jgi:hypothetical protein
MTTATARLEDRTSEDRMSRRTCSATIIAIAAPVIVPPVVVVVVQTTVVVARATNQAILLALITAYLTTLIAREPAVRTKDASLRAKLSLALAQ